VNSEVDVKAIAQARTVDRAKQAYAAAKKRKASNFNRNADRFS